MGSALAMVMFAILMTITALYYRAFRRSGRIF
jgi:ABC-type sugar transport system permease subunit